MSMFSSSSSNQARYHDGVQDNEGDTFMDGDLVESVEVEGEGEPSKLNSDRIAQLEQLLARQAVKERVVRLTDGDVEEPLSDYDEDDGVAARVESSTGSNTADVDIDSVLGTLDRTYVCNTDILLRSDTVDYRKLRNGAAFAGTKTKLAATVSGFIKRDGRKRTREYLLAHLGAVSRRSNLHNGRITHGRDVRSVKSSQAKRVKSAFAASQKRKKLIEDIKSYTLSENKLLTTICSRDSVMLSAIISVMADEDLTSTV